MNMQDPVTKIGKNFLSVMDMAISKAYYFLADDAILDWFGLTIFGRVAIKQFLLSHLEKSHHSLKKVANIEDVNHQMLNPNKADVDLHLKTPKRIKLECGQGDVGEKVTPDCPIRNNHRELAKAPRRGKMKPHKITRRLRFVEIKGKVQIEEMNFDGIMRKRELSVRRIVLGIDDEDDVSFVMYEGKGPRLQPRKLVFD